MLDTREYKLLQRVYSDEGQGMVEYGLILVLVAMMAVMALRYLGRDAVFPMYERVRTLIPKVSYVVLNK